MPELTIKHDPISGKPCLQFDKCDFHKRLMLSLGIREISADMHFDALLAGYGVFIDYMEERPRRLENSILQVGLMLQQAFEAGYQARVKEDINAALDENARRVKRKSKVYFIRSGDGPIKIGMAVDVEKRRRTLQTAHPWPLTTLATCEGGKRREAYYHELFCDHRQEGEWFAPHPDILAEIERLSPNLQDTDR